MSTELSARLDELEVRFAHQEQTIDDLNAAITAQWKQIDELIEKVTRLTQQVRGMENVAGAPNVPEPPPPHY
ncbi:MAG TPA: SlyX family protein [Alphaproteobacteria bacterium]|nr:SlyX family protein [Alphaproteobacteria bacterium]